MTPYEQALLALQAALEKKALEPVLLDLAAQGSYTDYLLLLSGTSDRHVQTIADAVVEAFHKARLPILGVEGRGEGRWVLIDRGDVVIHVFHHPLREHYDLEGMWSEAPRVPLAVPAEARVQGLY